MNVMSVTFEIGGIARELRAVSAVRRLVPQLCGGVSLAEAINDRRYLPEVAFAMIHDANGKPPADIPDPDTLARLIPIGEGEDKLFCAIRAAFSAGKKSPEEVWQMLAQARAEETTTLNGSNTGPSAPSSSESAP